MQDGAQTLNFSSDVLETEFHAILNFNEDRRPENTVSGLLAACHGTPIENTSG